MRPDKIYAPDAPKAKTNHALYHDKYRWDLQENYTCMLK